MDLNIYDHTTNRVKSPKHVIRAPPVQSNYYKAYV